jgi:hypothetical protein
MNPFQGLLRSRKFWVAMFDLGVSLVLYFSGKYLAPAVADDIKFVIAAIQPVFLLVIGGIAYEDGQAKRGGAWLSNLPAESSKPKGKQMPDSSAWVMDINDYSDIAVE